MTVRSKQCKIANMSFHWSHIFGCFVVWSHFVVVKNPSNPARNRWVIIMWACLHAPEVGLCRRCAERVVECAVVVVVRE